MPSGTYELQQQVGSFMAYYIHLIERSCNMLVLGCWDRNPATDHGTNRLCRDQRITGRPEVAWRTHAKHSRITIPTTPQCERYKYLGEGKLVVVRPQTHNTY